MSGSACGAFQSAEGGGTAHAGSGAPSQQVTVFCLQPGHSQRLANGSYCVPQCRHSTPAVSLTGVTAGAGGAPVAVVGRSVVEVVTLTRRTVGLPEHTASAPRCGESSAHPRTARTALPPTHHPQSEVDHVDVIEHHRQWAVRHYRGMLTTCT